MDKFATLIEILRNRAFQKSDQIAYTFLKNGETEEVSLTYQQLDLEARAIASYLQSLGATGERALLLYPPGLEFISAFLGCLYAGVVAVPAYPPRSNMKLSRLQAIAQDAEATFALTTTSVLANIQDWLLENPNLGQLHWLATDSIDSDIAQSWHEPIVRSDTLALLQYTSGSTDTPKGVMVSHSNLLSNCADLDLGWNHTPDSVIVTWLPTFHDMGLIYGVIEPLYKGCSCYMMSPVSFLQKPVRWLQAISTYQATHSGAPNFAYALSVAKITPEQKASLNLSSWRMALNGAEPVRADVMQKFAETFKPCGFDLTAFCPGYGLAEATLKVAAVRQQDMPVFLAVDGDALVHNRVVAAKSDAPNVQTLVGCGRSEIDTEIAIVHPESLTQCQAAEVGEIWVSGSAVAVGYWRQTEQTAQTFQAYLADTGAGPFLRTGDLGFLQNGELFVTGRLKDIIIIRGQNHYPQDIELTVQKSHPALRLNCGAAFTIEKKGEERLVVVQEVERTYLRRLNIKEVVGNIKETVIDNHGLQVYTTVLIKPGSIPKTSSGKIQRHACRHRFIDGSLHVVEDWNGSSQNNAEFQNLDADVNSLLAKVQPDNPESKRANLKQNVEVNIT